MDGVLSAIKAKYAGERVTDIDGVKIDFPAEWVHLRKSNTEPIIRIYSESRDEASAEALARRIMADIREATDDSRINRARTIRADRFGED